MSDILTPEQQAEMCRLVNRFVRPGMTNFERQRTAVRWLFAKMTGEIASLRQQLAVLAQWQPMSTAPHSKDWRRTIDVMLKFNDSGKGDPHLDGWVGKQMVGHWTQYGWNFAGPTGFGGFGDHSFEGWKPLPPSVHASATTTTCTWTEDSDGIYRTACGHAYMFTFNGPEDNGQQFCGYCGKRLIQVAYVEPAEPHEDTGATP